MVFALGVEVGKNKDHEGLDAAAEGGVYTCNTLAKAVERACEDLVFDLAVVCDESLELHGQGLDRSKGVPALGVWL